MLRDNYSINSLIFNEKIDIDYIGFLGKFKVLKYLSIQISDEKHQGILINNPFNTLKASIKSINLFGSC